MGSRTTHTSLERLRKRHDPLTSLVLTLPVFVLYHLGILAIDLRNGVDLVSDLTFRLLDQSLVGYVALTLAVAAGLLGAAVGLGRKNHVRPRAVVPILVESGVLAVLMLMLVGWATRQLFSFQTGGVPLSPVDKIVMSAGAGFHEELVFRVGLFYGGAFLLMRFLGRPRASALLVAALVSSILFSWVHYVGGMGDSFGLVSFSFRFLAGAYLAAVYHFRGFAVAVYTHFLYDVMVFFA